jgi:hypothetical protein
MPDLATHVILAAGVSLGVRNKRATAPLVLGAVLPDALSRIPSILFSDVLWYAEALHTPFVLLLCCYLISHFFTQQHRAGIFGWMCLGVVLHLVPDALQRHVSHGYFWLFPFSFFDYTWGLYWSEESLVVLPGLLIAAALIFAAVKRAGKA